MPATSHINYLHHREIDREKWDACINQAGNGLIYAYSFYLDRMAGDWDALVLNDYQAVMPLPWRKKYGFHYLYQPFLTAQLGLFGNDLNEILLNEFLKAIPAKFRLWEFSLNHGNLYQLKDFELYQRKNYVLHLSPPYDLLYSRYRENSRRNIKKSEQYGCYLRKGIDVNEIARLASSYTAGSSVKELNQFEILFGQLQQSGKAETYGIFSSKHELIASAAFLFSHRRAYYILVGNHPNGRTLGASHALLNAFIRDHAGEDLVLDFEGSDLRNLAFFYSSFGAGEEIYPAIRFNRLPWYVRLFKK